MVRTAHSFAPTRKPGWSIFPRPHTPPPLSTDSRQKKAPNNRRGVVMDCRRAGRGQQNTRVTLSSSLAAAMAAIRVAVAAGSWGKAPSGQMRTHCWQRTQCSAITG